MSTNVTGKASGGRPCLRCGKIIGGFFGGGRFQPSRHNTPAGKKCRYTGEGGDYTPDPAGCASCRIIEQGGSAFCRKHKRAGVAKGADAQTRELIEKFSIAAGIPWRVNGDGGQWVGSIQISKHAGET